MHTYNMPFCLRLAHRPWEQSTAAQRSGRRAAHSARRGEPLAGSAAEPGAAPPGAAGGGAGSAAAAAAASARHALNVHASQNSGGRRRARSSAPNAATNSRPRSATCALGLTRV
jgi:hypothetical protein